MNNLYENWNSWCLPASGGEGTLSSSSFIPSRYPETAIIILNTPSLIEKSLIAANQFENNKTQLPPLQSREGVHGIKECKGKRQQIRSGTVKRKNNRKRRPLRFKRCWWLVLWMRIKWSFPSDGYNTFSSLTRPLNEFITVFCWWLRSCALLSQSAEERNRMCVLIISWQDDPQPSNRRLLLFFGNSFFLSSFVGRRLHFVASRNRRRLSSSSSPSSGLAPLGNNGQFNLQFSRGGVREESKSLNL